MSFTTTGTEEKRVDTKYLKPGINLTTIGTVEGITPEAGSPYIEMGFYKMEGDPEANTKVRFYMSEKGIAKSLEKIKHIATKVVKASEIDSITADTVEDYGLSLNKLLSGKSLRMKFIGEEYKNASQQIKVKTTVGLPAFAEAINEGAEYPITTDTKLKFSENNPYDMKKLPVLEESGESTGKLGW